MVVARPRAVTTGARLKAGGEGILMLSMRRRDFITLLGSAARVAASLG
jgi:hypothetical protein